MSIPNIESDEIKSFLAYLGEGVDWEVAAGASMLSVDQLRIWMDRGAVEDSRLSSGSNVKPRKAETPYLVLYRKARVETAKSLAELQVNLHHSAKDDWRASLAILERRMPERFAKVADRKALREMEAGVTYAAASKAIDADAS